MSSDSDWAPSFQLPAFKFVFAKGDLVVSERITELEGELAVMHIHLIHQLPLTNDRATMRQHLLTGNLFEEDTPQTLRVEFHADGPRNFDDAVSALHNWARANGLEIQTPRS